MKLSTIKIYASVLICSVAIAGSSFTSNASNLSQLLPAAGFALTMGEGKEAKEVKKAAEEKAAKRQSSQSDSSKSSDGSSTVSLTDKLTSKASDSKDNESQTAEAKEASSGFILDNLKSNKEFSPVYDEDGNAIDEDDKKSEDGSSEDGDSEEIDRSELSEEELAKLEREEKKEEEAKKEEEEFSKLVIAKVNDYVNIRDGAGEDNEIVGKLYDKSVGEFIEEEDGWYKIKSGSVTGYVKSEYCVTGDDAIKLAKKVGTRVAVVNTTTLKVREDASLDSAVLGLVPIEEELSVVEETDEWVKVDIEEGYGYVHYDYVILRTDFVEAESIEEEKARLAKEEAAKKAAAAAAKKAQEKISSNKKTDSSSKKSNSSSGTFVSSGGGVGSEVVNYAMQFVGNPYVYGGSSLTNGTDCSGFVMSVYKNFGVNLPHSSTADRSQGYDVGGLSNAKAGDLVCYSGHVGIYAGNGKIVHASNARTGIIVSDANYRNVLAVRRIF